VGFFSEWSSHAVYEGSSLVARIETPLFFLGWVSSVFGIGYLLNLWHKDRKAIVAGIQLQLKVGGFGDGHTVAASGVFPVGREEAFLEALDALVPTVAT
jgi:hypothetical protein